MGMENYSGNTLWLSVSCGKLTNKKKDIHCNAYTGTINKIEVKKDEYEGKEIEKVVVSLKDGEENAKIQFTLESWYSVGFFQRITSVDLYLPVTIGAMGSDLNEKMSFCWMKQGDKKIDKTEIAKPKKVKLGNKEVTDFTEFLEVAGAIIVSLTEKLGENEPQEDKDLPF